MEGRLVGLGREYPMQGGGRVIVGVLRGLGWTLRRRRGCLNKKAKFEM